MEQQKKKRIILLGATVVFAMLILWAFLRAKATLQ
jgi:hypothetical protein